jgi:hypothetical protein
MQEKVEEGERFSVVQRNSLTMAAEPLSVITSRAVPILYVAAAQSCCLFSKVLSPEAPKQRSSKEEEEEEQITNERQKTNNQSDMITTTNKLHSLKLFAAFCYNAPHLCSIPNI